MTMMSLSVTYSSSIGSGLFVVLVGIKHFQIYILVTIIFDRFCAHTKLATSAKGTSSNKISYCLALHQQGLFPLRSSREEAGRNGFDR